VKKQYKLEYADGYEITIEIDHAIMTDEQLHEINNFWGDAEGRLYHDDVLTAVLKMFMTTWMHECCETFDPEQRFNSGEIEGWPPLDGRYGIKLVDYEPYSFESDNVYVREVETA
jgi:hypothetical protein